MEKIVLADKLVTFLLGSIVALLFQIIWNWLVTGRVEKGVYLLAADCERRRKDCGIGMVGDAFHTQAKQFAEYKSKTDVQLEDIDHQLSRGREDFTKIIEEISQIKQALVGMPKYSEFNVLKDNTSDIRESMASIRTAIEILLERRDTKRS